jgi:hypothetical protein
VRRVCVAWRLPGVWLLAAVFGAVPVQAQPSLSCEVHVYPAQGVHSVGEDFDAVHDVDQDLAAYDKAAGRPLNWLTTERQLAILGEMHLGPLVGRTAGPATLYSDPLTRHQALKAGPRTAPGACVYEVMLPQILLERGGLATRSLRIFGVVRRYEGGALVRGYSGFAAAPMAGFRLKSPADADAATTTVEGAYRNAVETLLRNSLGNPKSKNQS